MRTAPASDKEALCKFRRVNPTTCPGVRSLRREREAKERPYGEAKKAAAEVKWFIVKAAAWCAPCKRMDNTTWRDEKVVAWLTANAIAVQIDVDEQQKLAGELKIEAMPTVIAIRNADQEFDRIVGYKGPSDTLAWLEGIGRGTKYIDAITKLAGNPASSQGKVDIRTRLELARSLQQIGKADQAAEEYAWLWRHMLDYYQAYYGVRLSFMASDMERLATRNQGAKKKFSDLLADRFGETGDGRFSDAQSVRSQK